MRKAAPVALFGYNRADHLEETVKHLRLNECASATDIFLFSDGPRNAGAEAGVAEVRRFGKAISGFGSVTVVERDGNWGLRRSMIEGVASVAQRYERAIVLEDDIVTCPTFLAFMNDALDFYEPYCGVGSISGYMAPYVTGKGGLRPEQTVFHYRTNCWGWATWWDRWGKANWNPENWQRHLANPGLKSQFCRAGTDMAPMFQCSMDGTNQSWMARWYYNCYLHGMLTLYPGASLVTNIGFDGSGTHSSNARKNTRAFDKYKVDLSKAATGRLTLTLPVAVDPDVHRRMQEFWNLPWYVDSALGQAVKPYYRRLRSVLRGA